MIGVLVTFVLAYYIGYYFGKRTKRAKIIEMDDFYKVKPVSKKEVEAMVIDPIDPLDRIEL